MVICSAIDLPSNLSPGMSPVKDKHVANPTSALGEKLRLSLTKDKMILPLCSTAPIPSMLAKLENASFWKVDVKTGDVSHFGAMYRILIIERPLIAACTTIPLPGHHSENQGQIHKAICSRQKIWRGVWRIQCISTARQQWVEGDGAREQETRLEGEGQHP